MGQAEAGAGEHGDDRFGDHRHVDRYAVTGDEAEVGESVCGAADFGEEVVVGQIPGIAWFAFEVNGDAVAVAGEDVAVDAVVGDVEFSADEPLGDGGVGPVEDVGPFLVPVKALSLIRPESEAVGICGSLQLRSRIGGRSELCARRICLGDVCFGCACHG